MGVTPAAPDPYEAARDRRVNQDWDVRRRSWRPPMPFTVRAVERLPGKTVVTSFWVTPYLVDEHGRTHYVAAGQAGQSPGRYALVQAPGLPRGSSVRTVTEIAQDGREVFGKIDHTMN